MKAFEDNTALKQIIDKEDLGIIQITLTPYFSGKISIEEAIYKELYRRTQVKDMCKQVKATKTFEEG